LVASVPSVANVFNHNAVTATVATTLITNAVLSAQALACNKGKYNTTPTEAGMNSNPKWFVFTEAGKINGWFYNQQNSNGFANWLKQRTSD
jgi:hypothetical protein